MADLVLPANGWKPRPYQMRAWRYLANGGKRAVTRWHRRAGKDDLFLHHTCCAMHERKGNYWYLLPQFNQARKSMWDAIDGKTGQKRMDNVFPRQLIERKLDDEMKIVMKNGSTFQLMGSDNFDALVGSPPVGLVFSEYAISNPSSWGYLRPILLENGGWAAFNSTPRGANHFKDMCTMAQERQVLLPNGDASPEGWLMDVVTAKDSGVFTEAQLQDELSELQQLNGEEYGHALWLQEYFVDFDAAVPGAIFADAVARMKAEGRIAPVSHTPGIPVHAGWDLGMTDDTAIWWFQVIKGEVRFLHTLSTNNKDISWYCDKLKTVGESRGFEYGVQILPHDARPRTLAAGGKSMLQQFNEWNNDHKGILGKFVIAKRLDKQEQIQAARATLHKSRIDSDNCEDGIAALNQYHREWDDDLKVFKNSPVHDWSSHLVDSLCCIAVAWRDKQVTEAKYDGPPSPETLMRGSIGSQTFGALREAHLRKARGKRESLKMGG